MEASPQTSSASTRSEKISARTISRCLKASTRRPESLPAGDTELAHSVLKTSVWWVRLAASLAPKALCITSRSLTISLRSYDFPRGNGRESRDSAPRPWDYFGLGQMTYFRLSLAATPRAGLLDGSRSDNICGASGDPTACCDEVGRRYLSWP